MNKIGNRNEIIERTVGDSRGYLWKISIDKIHGIGKLEKISGLRESMTMLCHSIDGTEYQLQPENTICDDMQYLTSVIESRFRAA